VPNPTRGRPRRTAIIELVRVEPYSDPIIDVGCDHGYIASAVHAIGSERAPNRLPNARSGQYVVADGLLPYSHVGMAIITGLGAREIARILDNGPTPEQAVLHAPDRPHWLRAWLADHGYRITHERLAPEARGFAEVMRVCRGVEPTRGHPLWFGPQLRNDPHVVAHVQKQLLRWRHIRQEVGESDLERSAEVAAWLTFLEALLMSLRK